MTLQQTGKIVIAGGSGFLGRPLVDLLVRAGHSVVVLSRDSVAGNTPARRVTWKPDGSASAWADEIDGARAVINLSGESIAGKRWTDEQKRRILESRVLATRSLVAAIAAAAAPPPLLISGSAVGYYGPCGDEPVTEQTRPGRDFLASVCSAWESEAQRAESERTTVVALRTGLVLARDGGALPQMLPPFWFGVGGPVGSGRQYWPWIHRHDWLALVAFLLTTPEVSGPVNATAPTPVANRDFAKVLGQAMHRPSFMPTPAFALKLLLGEMADGLLLAGQRALPTKAEKLGFQFTYPRLDGALADLFKA